MRTTLILLTALTLVVSTTEAHTTKDLLFRCTQDATSCASKIKEVRHRMEYPPAGRPVTKVCWPDDIGDDELVRAVTGWIDEQGSRYDNREDDESIAAALGALYPCSGLRSP